MRYFPLLLTMMFFLTGCQRAAAISAIPPIPAHLHDVTPIGGSSSEPWVATDGRMQANFFGNQVSCRAVIRHLQGGEIRMALISDEGVRLLDLSTTTTAPGFAMHAHAAGMERVAPTVAYVIRHTWGPPSEARIWEGHIQRGDTSDGTRWYGGTPPSLRLVTDGEVTITIDDYQSFGDHLVAHRAQGESLTRTLTITLGRLQ